MSEPHRSAEPNDAGRPRVAAPLLYAAMISGCLVLVAAAVLLVGWLLVRVAAVSLAVLAALLLAALLTPVSHVLRRLRIPRGVAALLTVLLLLALLVGPMVLVGRQVASKFRNLGTRLGEGLDRIRQLLVDTLPLSPAQVEDLWRQAGQAVAATLPGPASGALAAAEGLAAAILALVLLFFLLKDGEQMWQWVLRLAPQRRWPRLQRAAEAGWQALTGYVRGTIVIAAADATGIGLALLLLGVPLALPLMMLTFFAAFVPILGATVAGGAAVLVALVASGTTDALLVLAAVIAVQQIEGNLLEPLVMGRAVRLHPAVILVVVSAGALLGGVAGALVAVPLTAVSYRVVSVLAEQPGDRLDEEAGPARPVPERVPEAG